MLIDWAEEFDGWWRNIEEQQSLNSRSRQIAFTLGTQLGPCCDGFNKAKMGDIFYDGVGNRADNLIQEYLRDEENQ